MRLFSSKKRRQLIGVDVTTTAVKIVELHSRAHFFHLNSYIILPLTSGMVVDSESRDPEEIADIIRKAMQLAGITNKLVASALSGSAVITKVIEMDAYMGDSEREARIRLDSEQYIPYPLEEVNLDFEVLGDSEFNPDYVQVLLAASRSENVQKQVEILAIAGLEAKVIDIESHAIERSFFLMCDTLPNKPNLVALIDIGHTQMSLYIAKDGNFIYNREQVFGGQQLTEVIQDRYSLSYEEASMYKQGQFLPSNYINEILTPFVNNIIQQISRSLQFYYSSSNYNDIDHVVLCGGSAGMQGLVEAVEKKLETPTTIANPFINMSINSKINNEQLTIDAPSLMAACGLALRSAF